MPSTSTVPAPTTSAGSGTNSARTCPISGRSTSQRRLTVDWLTSKIAPANAWVRLVRSKHTTSATEQAQRIRAPAGGEPTAPNSVHPSHQLGELLIVEPCHSLIPQRQGVGIVDLLVM